MTASTISPTSPAVRAASRIHPAQRLITVCGLGIIVGSFLTWIYSPVHNFNGFEGAGRFTFYLGVLIMGAGLLPLRSFAVVQASISSAVVAFFGLWQLLHAYQLLGLSGWLPGPGLVMVVSSALITLGCSYRIVTTGKAPSGSTV